MATQLVYSKRFVQGAGSNWFTSPPVPASVVWIIRSIDIVSLQAVAQPFGAFVSPEGIWLFNTTLSQPDNGNYHWRGRQVLETGDTLTLDLGSGGYGYASGYELQAT